VARQVVDQLGAAKVACGGFLESQANADIYKTPDAERSAEFLISAAYKLDGMRVYPFRRERFAAWRGQRVLGPDC
jgi:hypothetical protein